ncbi:hypothetical protein K523DRAFT_406622 [Schizophyllum commune Tattone D]|nr:hypothetical protein K523DRAFT_406622 [Schizophyllum commune Tattone D]
MRIGDLMRKHTPTPRGLVLSCSPDADPENTSLDQLLTWCPPAEMPRKAPSLPKSSPTRGRRCSLLAALGTMNSRGQHRFHANLSPRRSVQMTHDTTSQDLPAHSKPQSHPTPQVIYLPQVTYLATVS